MDRLTNGKKINTSYKTTSTRVREEKDNNMKQLSRKGKKNYTNKKQKKL